MMDNEKDKLRKSLHRLTGGVYTKQDVEQIAKMQEHEEAFDLFAQEANEVYQQTEASEPLSAEEINSLQKEGERLLKGRSIRFHYVRRVWGYAAAIAAIVLLGYGGWAIREYRMVQDIRYTEIKVAYGTREKVLLPDGTIVELNAGSTFVYPSAFRGDNRKVRLNGEAYFDVEKDPKKAFVIETASMNIRVLGTSFNVKAYSDDEQAIVNVRTGLVEVSVPDATIRLKKDEQVVYNTHSSAISRQECQAANTAVWMNNVLYFENASIESVAKELMRRYNCTIMLDAESEFPERISGRHDNTDLRSVLESLDFITGIKARMKDGNTVVLYKEKD